MTEHQGALRGEERVQAEDLLYAQLLHTGEAKIKWIAFGIAVLLHVVVLAINFPEFKQQFKPQQKEAPIVVKKYVPPPPKVQRRQIVKKKFTRKVPIPDPTPDEPEPIREPEPDIEPEPLPPDADFVIGVPEPPPPSGPVLAGVGGVSQPKRIEESYIKPTYPELARVARLEGRVILQAVIHKDGSVGEIEVLSCNRPGMGFEDAAVQAVKQWRYEPATQGDKPVDVFFTVNVEFELQ